MKRKLIILSAALLCIVSCICGCGNGTAEKSLEEGKIALASSEYGKAEKLFKLACDSDGSDEEAVQYYDLVSGYNKAQEYADNKEYEKSEKQLSDLKSSVKYDSIKKDAEKLEKEIKENKADDESNTNKNNGNNIVIHKEKEPSSAEYLSYTNSRYGYSIQYPGNMTVISESDNGDGAVFESADGTASLVVSGLNNVNDETPESVYNKELSYFSKEPEYKQLMKDSFVISWVENGNIIYKCCVVGNGSMNTFILKYPADQKAEYERVTEKVYSSFKSPGVGSSH